MFPQSSDPAIPISNPEAEDDDSDSDDYQTPIDPAPLPPGPVLPPRSCLTRTDSQREALRMNIAQEIDEVSEQVIQFNTSR